MPAPSPTASPLEETDVQRWRAETPGAERRVHLNNAGAALMPHPVIQAVQAHLERESEIGGYEAADVAEGEIEAAYASVAALIGADVRNVAFAENATAATAQALSSFDSEPGDAVLTSNADYVSYQLMLLSLARRRGVRVLRAADLPEGGVDPDSVRRLLRERRPKLVLLAWVPTNSGLVQDVEAVGRICQEADVPFILDACQAVGQLPVDVRAVPCDFLTATSRKFLRGPRGMGFLYVSDRALEAGRYPLALDLRGGTWTAPDRFELAPTARRFENWEFAYALVLGLGAAARYAQEVGVERTSARAAELAAYARERLGALPGARVLDRGRKRCAIATFAFSGTDAHELAGVLRTSGVNTSVAARSSALVDMDAKGVQAALRVSPHYYNTREEVDRLAEAVTGARGVGRKRA